MAETALSGMTEVGNPILLPKTDFLEKTTSNGNRRTTSKPTKMKDPKGTWKGLYDYKIAEAQYIEDKVMASNQLYSLSKKYGGDFTAMSNDPEFQRTMAYMRHSTALMTANRAKVEEGYNTYKDQRKKIEKDKSAGKLALDDDYQPMFYDQSGQLRSRNDVGKKVEYEDSEGKKKSYNIKKESDYLTYGQLLDYNYNNIGYNPETGIMGSAYYGNSVDYTKNAVSEDVYKWLTAAAGKNEEFGQLPSIQHNEDGTFTIIGEKQETNLGNLERMTQAALQNMSHSAKAQLAQDYYTSDYADSKMYRVPVDTGQKDEEGNPIYDVTVVEPTKEDLENIKKKIDNGEELSIQEKTIATGRSRLTDAEKFQNYAGKKVVGYASGLKHEDISYDVQGLKAIGGGGAGDSSTMNYTEQLVNQGMVNMRNGISTDIDYFSLVKPATYDGDEISTPAQYEKISGKMTYVPGSSAERESYREKNATYKEMYFDDEDELEIDAITNSAENISETANSIMIGGQAIDSKTLKGAGGIYVVGETPGVVIAMKTGYDPNTKSYNVGESTDKATDKKGQRYGAYRKKTVVMHRDTFENLTEQMVGGRETRDQGVRQDNVTAGFKGNDNDLLPGSDLSIAAESLGFKYQDVDAYGSLGWIKVDIWEPIGDESYSGNAKSDKATPRNAEIANSRTSASRAIESVQSKKLNMYLKQNGYE
jgi:hypothetical protein